MAVHLTKSDCKESNVVFTQCGS